MKITKVKICNEEYLIRGGESDEYIEKLALFVDKKMNAIMSSNSKLSVSNAAVLTAINTADDYFKERDMANRQKASMDDIEKRYKEQNSKIKILETKLEKLTASNTELKNTLQDTKEELTKAQNEFR